jgi:hypothetical protein
MLSEDNYMAKNEEDSNKLNGTPEGPVSGFEPNTTSPGSTDVSTSTGAGGGGTFVNDFGMTVAVPTSPVFPGVPNSDVIHPGKATTWSTNSNTSSSTGTGTNTSSSTGTGTNTSSSTGTGTNTSSSTGTGTNTSSSTGTGTGSSGTGEKTFVNDFGMTVAVPTSPVFPGVPNSDVIHPGKATTWSTGASAETTSNAANTDFVSPTDGKLKGGPVSIIPGTTTPTTGASTGSGAPTETTPVAGGGSTTGQWKWPWQRSRSSSAPGSSSHGSIIQDPLGKVLEPTENNAKNAQSTSDNNKDQRNVQGGYPMNPSTDDPANNAFGSENPETHNTDPFKSK